MAGRKPIDPLFAEYARTAPLADTRFQLQTIAARRARGVDYDGPGTAAIVAELVTLEADLAAVIERREKSKTVPATTAAQKRIVWHTIDRYRQSLDSSSLHLIDGRPAYEPDPYVPSSDLTAVWLDPYAGPFTPETVAGYLERVTRVRPLTEPIDRAVTEVRAAMSDPDYEPEHSEAARAWLERITAAEPPRAPRAEPISGAAAELLFWDAARALRILGTLDGEKRAAVHWSADLIARAAELEAEKAASKKPRARKAKTEAA